MELWFVIIVTVCVAALFKSLLSLKSEPKQNAQLPPGPRALPIIRSIIWMGKSLADIEAYLRTIRPKFGPIITLHFGSRPVIFVSSRSLAHQALVQKGAVFADRPKALPTAKLLTSNQHNISSAGYGPAWRLLRRNLTAEILHSSRAKDYCHARKWTLDILLNRLRASAASETPAVKVMDQFRFSMFCLLVFMCFGDKLDETKIREIATMQHQRLTSSGRYQMLNICPSVTRFLLCSRWNEFFEMLQKHQELLIPLIRAREQLQQQRVTPDASSNSRLIASYVDTLLNLQISDEGEIKRKLSEDELVAACSEFLNAGTDTTSTALQWIMANIVKYTDIQAKLYQEIRGVVGDEAEEVKEEDVSKMPYLKAVILEGLRRHPPGHFVLPHAVTQETELGGYRIPKNAVINFTVADMGWDPEVWEDPMQFKPERFLSGEEEFDITGSREIKMMPFGAGRRICPGFGLAMLHLEYYVANLVWSFEWAVADGYEVDFSEKQEFTTVMKYPLHACISPRKS